MTRPGRMTGSRAAVGALLAVLLAATGATRASSPVVWEYPPRDPKPPTSIPGAHLHDGEITEGVTLAAGGSIGLSLPVREIFPGSSKIVPPPLFWSARTEAGGTLYLGSGNTGQVFAIDRKGTASVLFDAEEIGVRGLAIDPSGDLYVATFPEGAIFRVAPDGRAEPWFAPEERYLWAMAVDPAGRLFVSTGERGIVYQVTGRSSGEVWFDSDESHVTSLAVAPDGGLLAGTDPDGLLYHIRPDGRARVLLDTDLREVPTIVVTPEGVVYAAAVGEDAARPVRKPGDKSDMTIEITPAPDGSILEEQAELPRKITIDLAELVPSPEKGADGLAGRVYRIEPGGVPALIWKSDSERPYALAWSAERGLLLGTGGAEEGRVYLLAPDGQTTTLQRLPARQVTALLARADGRIYVCTSNPGRVYLLDSGTVPSGSYTSAVHDAGGPARWGSVSWDAAIPPGTRVEISTRSGNRPVPDDSWSDWSAPLATPVGSPVPGPAARYLQWKAILSRLKTDAAPLLRRVTVTALPENAPPRIGDLVVMDRGAPVRKPTDKTPPAQERKETPPPEGTRWVAWSGEDPDDDTLTYAVWLKGADEEAYRPIATGVAAPPYALRDADLPEGLYTLRLDADDSPTNGPERRLGTSMTSGAFLVDHTPPILSWAQESAPASEGRLVLEASAVDAIGTVAGGEYSIDGGNAWAPLHCRDGICDTPAERFLVDIPVPGAGSKLVIRVADAAGNKATIEAPSSRP